MNEEVDILEFEERTPIWNTTRIICDKEKDCEELGIKPPKFICAPMGIDLNCGCPKANVRKNGHGSKLLENPELISDIIRQTRARISDPDFSVSAKIRIKYPLRETVDLCQKLEKAGVSNVTIHARTVSQRGEPPDLEAISLAKSSVSIPIYANGDCNSYKDALEIVRLNIDSQSDMEKEPFHMHLNFMVRSIFEKKFRIYYHELKTREIVKSYAYKYLYDLPLTIPESSAQP